MPDSASCCSDSKRSGLSTVDAVLLAKGKVIHIVHRGSPNGLFDLDAHRGEIMEDLKPKDGERIIEKKNAFADNDLASQLGAPGQSILVAGFMTKMCVSSTVRAALDIGYPATIASDACATRDFPLFGGGVISAANLHAAELAALADRFAAVASVFDILRAQI